MNNAGVQKVSYVNVAVWRRGNAEGYKRVRFGATCNFPLARERTVAREILYAILGRVLFNPVNGARFFVY